MPLVSSAAIYSHAEKEGYIVPGFDSYCLEVIQAQIIAANEENSPFLLQVTPKGFRHIGVNYFVGMAKALLEVSKVPVALHLDHGISLEHIVNCIKNGFTSVMIDGSSLSFEQNVELTCRVVEIAHAVDVAVEAELGQVLGKESDIVVKKGEETYTDPEAAEEFVQRTGVDSLAVSVGTVHGFYKDTPHIDFERLKQISRRVKIPLVLHGGTGLGSEIIKKAASLGVRKINIGTLIKSAFTNGIREYLSSNPGEIDPRKVLGPARDKVVKEMKHILKTFGASNNNWLNNSRRG